MIGPVYSDHNWSIVYSIRYQTLEMTMTAWSMAATVYNVLDLDSKDLALYPSSATYSLCALLILIQNPNYPFMCK